MSHTPHFRRKTWSSSHYEELEKKIKEVSKFKEDQKIFYLDLGGPEI